MQNSVDTIYFKAFKIEQSLNKVTSSVSKVSINQGLSQNISLQEHIDEVPGLFSLNANNYAQDLRISIRGFGARSPFGIRGIKIVVDGIPETTPDGQGQIDNLNLNLLENIEVIKGPAAVYYGNASGGVININTLDELIKQWQGDISIGSFGLKKYNLSFSKKINNTQLLLNANHIKSNGYRYHSEFESSTFQLKLKHHFSPAIILNLNSAYTNSPIANDPGGINFESANTSRNTARARNILFDSGESINQFKLGTSLGYKINATQNINSFAYVSNRNFNGKLPFEFGGAIDLKRIYWGHGTAYSLKRIYKKNVNTFKLGYEIGFQSDLRSRFKNLEGLIGDLTLDQDETFNNISLFALNKHDVGNLSFTTGLRYDINRISVTDQFLSNGDQSDQIQLNAFNPSVGFNYQLGEITNLFANYRTSFETPVLSELSANPTGLGGFNIELKPQKAQNFEVGIRSQFFNKINIDLTYFNILTRDELISYELPMDDRTYFENAGKTKRKGIELAMNFNINKSFTIQSYYTFNNLKFGEFISNGVNFNGKKLPGVPNHYGGVILKGKLLNKIGFYLDSSYRGFIFVDNVNSINEKSVLILNLKLNSEVSFSSLIFKPFIAINNLTNVLYSDNIRINAFGGRYYEPAPERNFVIGMKFMM